MRGKGHRLESRSQGNVPPGSLPPVGESAASASEIARVGNPPQPRPTARGGDEAARGSLRGGDALRREGWTSRRTATLTLSFYVVAAVVVTWRLWADPASRIVAGNPDDADLFAWYLRYAATAIAHGQLPALTTGALNAPAGINLMWNSSMLLPAIALSPVTLAFGPQVSLTVLTTIGFAGSAAAMYLVLRRWQVSQSAAALAGAVYGFSPALLQSAIGHYDLQLAVLPPLIIDAMLRIATSPRLAEGPAEADLRPGIRRGIGLGLLITAELFISEELALTTVLAGFLLLAWLAAGFPRQAARQAAAATFGLGIAGLTTLLVAGWALWVQFFGPLTQSGTPFLRDFYVNDLSGFVTPSAYLLFHTADSAAQAALYRGQSPEYLAYLGWPLIIMLVIAVIAFWRRPVVRALAGTTAVLAVLSLGGYPLVSGVSHPSVNLPWHWLENLPLGGSVLADRLSILVGGVAAVLLALALDLARQYLRPRVTRPKAALAGVVAALACLPLIPAPLPVSQPVPLPAGWNAAFTSLDLPAGARVLVVPVPEVHLTEAMRWAADTGRQFDLIGGYFIGPAWNGEAYVDGNGLPPTAVYLNDLWASGLRAGSPLAEAAANASLGLPAKPASAQLETDLRSWQPAAVVADTARGSALARYLTSLFGKPSVADGAIVAWRRTTLASSASSTAIDHRSRRGTAWRDRPAISCCDGLAAATDQSAAPGLLAEVAIAAARLAVEQLNGFLAISDQPGIRFIGCHSSPPWRRSPGTAKMSAAVTTSVSRSAPSTTSRPHTT